jgi:hypothetical protein
MRRKPRKKSAKGGLHINWLTKGTAHFVVETKQGPIHFGIRMSKRPRKGIELIDPLRRVNYVDTRADNLLADD